MNRKQERQRTHRSSIKRKLLYVIPAVAVMLLFTVYINNNLPEYKASVKAGSHAPDKNIVKNTEPSPAPSEAQKPVTPSKAAPSPEKISKNDTAAAAKNEKIKANFKVEVDEKFFKGAVFVGDSITQGVSDYGFLDKKYVLAKRGLTISDAPDFLPSIVKLKPEAIYVMIGTDDLLGRLDGEKFAEKYSAFIGSIKEKLPDSKIYVQSLFPVAVKAQKDKPLMNPERIDEFNSAIIKMAQKQDVTYIDVASQFKNSSGYLPDELSTDGIHLKFKCYKVWMNYLQKNK